MRTFLTDRVTKAAGRPRPPTIGALFLSLLLLTVFFAPHAAIANRIVAFGWIAGITAVICFIGTFAAKVRVRIGRLGFRYRIVRRGAGAVVSLALALSIAQGISTRLWPSKSATPAVTKSALKPKTIATGWKGTTTQPIRILGSRLEHPSA
jgi:hypothetical protein